MREAIAVLRFSLHAAQFASADVGRRDHPRAPPATKRDVRTNGTDMTNTHGVSRRQFLRTSMVAAAGTVAAGARTWAHDEFVPAIVVGSGFGGAVAALRLAQAGIETLVLERGRRWPIREDGNTFATLEQPDGRAYWLRDRTGEAILGLPQLEKPIDRYLGVLEIVDGNGIFIGAGAGVGGGSLIYNAITVKPRGELFERLFPRALDFGEFEDVYYPRVTEMIRSAPIPDDILATDYYLSSRVSLDQATRAGFPTRPVELAVDWEIVRDEMAGRRVPSAIAGQSIYGINSGAMRSLDRSYLADAEATGHVEILPQHAVAAIGRTGGRYTVTTLYLGDDGHVIGTPRRFVCKYLFLAAGSIGTTKLLVNARATHALPELNGHVGRHWAANGDIPVIRGLLPPTNAGTGGPGGHFIMEDLDNPFGPTSLVEIVLPPHINAALTAAGAPGHFAYYASLGIPPALGTFSYDHATDTVGLAWPASDPRLESFLAAARRTLAAMDRSNGSLTLSFNPTVSAHPLGGAVLGKACDLDGRVRGCRGLYVVDGALIEGSTGLANPSLTIAALAERCMERILSRDHLSNRTGGRSA
jgi:cholesterol oxidase